MNDLPVVAGVEFRLLSGFTCYAVGDDGSVWSNCRKGGAFDGSWRQLKQRVTKGKWRLPYRTVSLRRNNGKGNVFTITVHRLVLEAFVGLRPHGMLCRHLDGDVANNSRFNLVWGTPKENKDDMAKHGTILKGERNPTAKLTDAKVREIRAKRSKGFKIAEIAAEYGVTETLVSKVANRLVWKHVD